MAPAEIGVEVVYAAAPHALQQASLRLPLGATAAEALRASGLPVTRDADVLVAIGPRVLVPEAEHVADLVHDDSEAARRRARGVAQVDAKEARRQRYRKDGVKKSAAKRR